MTSPGKLFILAGAGLIVVGLWLTYGPRLNLPLGRLPLDIHSEREGFSFHFPLGSCLLVSAVLSLGMWLLRKLGP